jgi:hypothetical protein
MFLNAVPQNMGDKRIGMSYIERRVFNCNWGVQLDLIRLHVLPPTYGATEIARLVIASPATRIVKSTAASPWEVFLCPEHAPHFSIHYHRPRRRKSTP